MQYSIQIASLEKATRIKGIGNNRPVVVIGEKDGQLLVCSITSRMRREQEKGYVKLNPYMISGYCKSNEVFKINKDHILGYKRPCTTSEENAIRNKLPVQYR